MCVGSRSRSHLRIKWLDEVVEVAGLSLQHLKEAARNRNGWRELTHVVTKGRDRQDGKRISGYKGKLRVWKKTK